jgi:MscS family membrane protein
MRKSAWSRRLVPMIIGSVALFLSMEMAAPASADTSPAQPSLKELVQKRSKVNQVGGSQLSESPVPGVPDDELNRGVPRSSVGNFLAAANERDYARAAEYLDLHNLPLGITASQGPELARQLKIVLDRVLWIDLDLVSASPDGDQTDGLPHERDRVGQIVGRERTYDLLLQQVLREDGVSIWKFAGTTVADIPKLYEEFGYGRLERVFPAWFFDVKILGIEVWGWTALVVIAIATLPIAFLLTALLMRILRLFRADLAPDIEQLFNGPVRMLLWVLMGRPLIDLTSHSVVQQSVSQGMTLLVVALAWIVLRCLDLIAQWMAKRFETRGVTGSRVLLRPAVILIKVLVVAGAALLWLENLGYEVTALLAGLSISGVAVAFAAQKSLENVFGAATLYTSQPVRVGDFCRFGDQVGTIEEIGLRATLVRTLDRTIISVPNAQFAYMPLENYSKRDRFWYHPCLKLRYETTPEQIRYLLVEVRKMLYAHPKVLSEPLSVRFRGFQDYSLDLDVFSYIGVTDYNESLEVAEDLNLRIMDIVAGAGTDFAIPAQIQFEAPARMLDDEKSKTAESQVGEWRTQQALYLPNFPREKVAELRGSLDYPPVGSPGAATRR